MTNFNELIHKIILYGAIFLCIIVVINIIVVKLNPKKESKNSLKGSGLIKGKEKGFIFGKLRKSYVCLDDKNEGHITIFGGSGQGKTSALLIPSLRAWNGSFFSIDISGDISKNVMVKDKMIINPDNPEESAIFNVFHGVDNLSSSEDKKEKLELLVYSIIDIPSSSSDTQYYFLSTARKIFLACMLGFYSTRMDFIDICKTVFFNSFSELVDLVYTTHNEIAIAYISSVTGENEKNIAGAKSTLNEKIKIFADNKNIEKIVRRPGNDEIKEYFFPGVLENQKVFLKVPDRKQEFYKLFLNLIISQVLDYVSAREYNKDKDNRILIALDEFASIGHLNILSPFRKFRKNGANLCILTQSLADIDLVYSEKERQVILDNSQFIVVLSATDNATRDYFSNLVGKEEKENKSKSISKTGSSTSISTQREFIISPEEWKLLNDELIVIHKSGFIKLKKNFYFK